MRWTTRVMGPLAALAMLVAVPPGPDGASAHPREVRPVPAEAVPAGELEAWLDRLGSIEKKMLGLVGVMDARVLAWRPAEGVRSTAEAMGHVMTTQYKLAEMTGHPLPRGLDLEALEKPADQAALVAGLRASFAHLSAAMKAADAKGLDRPALFWGRPSTVRRVLLKSLTHTAEHLGQLIAYGRANGVVPPWSRPKR